MIEIENLFDTKKAAKYLLGKEISCNGCSGIIIETEAYLQNDPTCHAYKGMTERNKPMFSKAGTIYVYFIYGMYMCLNIVTNEENIGDAVLIRSIFPTNGIDLMKNRRNTNKATNLCSGPGKLCQAFNIDKSLNNTYLDDIIKINDIGLKQGKIISTIRIGIKEDKPKKLRFYLENYKDYVSVISKT